MASTSSDPRWEDVVARLVAERGDALTRYAYLVSGNRDDASDLVQDALVKTFGRLRNGYTIASAEAYVRRAILNTYLDSGRRVSRWRKIAHLQAVPEVEEAGHAETEARLDLQGQLARLSPRERACIVLRYYEDLAELFAIDPASWRDEADATEEFFATFEGRVPAAVEKQLVLLREKLA